MIATDNTTNIIGHGLLSEVAIIDKDNNSYTGLVLAPLSVVTDFRGQGIGKKILNILETRAQELNYPFISILGSPNYYSKFHYVPASQYDIYSPYDVPNEAFMIKALITEGLAEISGVIKYSEAFN